MKEKIILKVKKCDKLEDLDDIDCGLFTSGNLNGGYCCAWGHKDKDDSYKCYSWNCPLASSADLSQLRKFDNTLFEQYCESFELEIDKANQMTDEELKDFDNACHGGAWMHQYYEVVSIDGAIDSLKEMLKEIDEDDLDSLDKKFEFEIIESYCC